MSRIFLSHSSRDTLQAIALKRWLVEQDPGLADEIFLDLDPVTGIQPGERWKEALRRSNARCEAVICLLSADWEASSECRTEFRTAESLNKLILCARLEPLSAAGITGEWQRCDLFGDGQATQVPIEGMGTSVSFQTEGLQRLLRGLRRAGIGAEHFVWPPPSDSERAPYRGWEPLEELDAAVFFGRDGQILRGLDALRGMRSSGIESLFVILGPSGAGKSSFLRAGLLPRLRRDDWHFVVLEIMRPERNALTGERGFAHSIHALRSGLGLDRPVLAEIKEACAATDAERIRGWLAEAREAAAFRLPVEAAVMPQPTLVLPLDQSEELFSVDSGRQATQFLELLGRLLRGSEGTAPALIVTCTVRADRYELLQTAPALTGLGSHLFDDLKPMPVAQFKEVIRGPAARATAAGRPLTVQPDLVDRLLSDSAEGADTLPLLSLTLARLYSDYEGSAELTLAAYEAMGGMNSVVQTEIDSLLSGDPVVRQSQLARLHSAFIPWLATISPESDRPMRRVARLQDLPPDAGWLIDTLVARRLLVKDERDGEIVVEVALESLLRQWTELAKWLESEREDLKEADNLERAADAWERSGCSEAWLLEGDRLTAAESLAAKPGFESRLASARGILRASRRRENDRLSAVHRQQEAELRAARDRQEAAETHAALLRKGARTLKSVLIAVVLVAMVAVAGFVRATIAEHEATVRAREATARRLAAEGQSMLAGARPGGEVRGMQQMLAAQALMPTAEGESAIMSAVVRQRYVQKIADDGALVNGVGFSPDGRRIASGDAMGRLRLWDASTGLPLGEPMTGHQGPTNSVSFSPDGLRIVSGGADGTVRLWDAATGAAVGSPVTGHVGAVNSVGFSPNGRRVATAGADGTVRLWDAATGAAAGVMTGHVNAVKSAAFSPDDLRVVSGGADGTVRLWDAITGTAVGSDMAGHVGAVNSVGFSPDGQRIVSAGADRTVRVWDAGTGLQIGRPMTGHKNWILAVAFSPDGRRIVSGSADYTVQLWDAVTREPVGEPMAGHGEEVASVSFSPDCRRIVSGMGDGTLRVWDVGTAPPIRHQAAVNSVAFSRTGERIISGDGDGMVRMWDAGTGAPVGEPMAGHKGAVNSVASSLNGEHAVSGGADGTLRLWDTGIGAPVGGPMFGHEGAVNSVAFSRSGERIVSGGADGTVRMWDSGTGAPVGEPMAGHEGAVNGVAFSPDERWVVSGGADGMVRLWDSGTGAPVGGPLAAHEGAVNTVAFSPDGRRIVSGGADRTLRLWDSVTGAPVGEPLAGHESAVNSVAFSPDGGRIVSGSADSTVRLWDAGRQVPVGEPMAGHWDAVNSVAFSPDGLRILSGSRDNTMRSWPAPSAWSAALCAKLTQNLSREQWRDWVSPDADYIEICPGLPVAADPAVR
jgi:WD40 repeat protein